MYHQGIDLSALVINVGSHSTKVGHAGADAPAAILPSALGARRRGWNGDDIESSYGAMTDVDAAGHQLGSKPSLLASDGRTRDGYIDDLDEIDACEGVDVKPATRDGLSESCLRNVCAICLLRRMLSPSCVPLLISIITGVSQSMTGTSPFPWSSEAQRDAAPQAPPPEPSRPQTPC